MKTVPLNIQYIAKRVLLIKGPQMRGLLYAAALAAVVVYFVRKLRKDVRAALDIGSGEHKIVRRF